MSGKSAHNHSAIAYCQRGCPEFRDRPAGRAVETTGMRLIRAERRRQIDAEGYSPQHDAEHGRSPLERAASCYEQARFGWRWAASHWPWRPEDFKPRDRISNLIRAGALYLAALDLPESPETTMVIRQTDDLVRSLNHVVAELDATLATADSVSSAEVLREAARDYREHVHDETRPGSLARGIGDDACAWLEQRADLMGDTVVDQTCAIEWGVQFDDGEVWSASKAAALWLSEGHDERPLLVVREDAIDGEWQEAAAQPADTEATRQVEVKFCGWGCGPGHTTDEHVGPIPDRVRATGGDRG